MPIPLPNLDDRSYSDLLDRARAQIPRLAPGWTDHNPTDPGIILIELFAWLTEMVMYRVNQVPEQNYQIFLDLLNGGEANTVSTGDLDTDIPQTIRALRARYRAATADDYEKLAMQDWHESESCQALRSAGRIQRARCLPERNLELTDPDERVKPAPGHVSLVVVPPQTRASSLEIKPSLDLRRALWRYFEERRLLTTRHHVVAPDYVKVTVTATLYLKDDASPDAVDARAVDHLSKFLHPLTGGPKCKGWPFGRDVHLSEIYATLDEVPGVNFVRDAQMTAPNKPQIGGSGNALESIKLEDHELVALDVKKVKFTFMERLGDKWKQAS